jgi:general secretion pathway protein B
MSFILDALRKSEAERLKQDVPGFVSVPDGSQQKSGKKWIWLVAGLLSVNLVIVAIVLLRPDPVVNPSETGSSGNIVETKPAAATVNDSAAMPIRRSANDIEPVADTPLQQTGTDLSAEADLIASVDAPSSPSANKTFVTFNNLRAQGVLNLPDMHLDIHVYAGQPADRFVFINMSKYKERATLTEGPMVKEITPEGVILEYRGTDFLLPRE